MNFGIQELFRYQQNRILQKRLFIEISSKQRKQQNQNQFIVSATSTKMQTNVGGKFMDIKRGFIKMLQAYRNIRKLIHKLTHKKIHHINDIDTLIQQVKRVHKINQREIRHFAELHLVIQVQSMLKSYIYKSDIKFRRYDVYSHVLCYLNLIQSKINEFIPKNIEICQITPDLMKWKLFVSQLNDNKQAIIKWYKDCSDAQYKMKFTQNQKGWTKMASFIVKTNALSTASRSANITSRMEKAEILIRKQDNQKKHSYLKRCQTAKLPMKRISPTKKKQYPINIRCPSAKQFIKRSSKTQSSSKISPNYNPNMLLTKIKRRPMKKKLFYRQSQHKDHQNTFQNSIQIIPLKQNAQSADKKYAKLKYQQNKALQNSIIVQNLNNESLQNQQRFNTLLQSKTNSNQFSNKRRSSIRKIKQNNNSSQTQIIKSSFSGMENQRNDNSGHASDNDEEQGADEQNTMTKSFMMNKRGKHFKMNTNVQVSQSLLEQSERQRGVNKSLQKTANDFNIKKNVNFQFSSQPLDFSSLSHHQSNKQNYFYNPSCQNQMYPKKSTRRNGIISTKQIINLKDKVQHQLNQEQQQRENQMKKKTIQFNQRLIEQFNDINDEYETMLDLEEQKSLHNIKNTSLNQFYKQLTWLKQEHMKAASRSPFSGESAFFIKQDILRQQKSRQLQEYIKKMKTKHRSLGEIFQLKCQDTNIKIQNYMRMERKYAFEADHQWINNHLSIVNMRNIAVQNGEPQLIQQSAEQTGKLIRVSQY